MRREKNMSEFEELSRQDVGEDEIDFLDCWRVIFKHRRLIGRIVLIVVIFAAVISLFMTNIYQAKALIMPVAANDSGTGALSALTQQFGALPGLMGVPAPGTASLEELTNLLNSNIVREKMIQKNNLLPILLHDLWDADKQDWKKKSILNPSSLIRKVAGAVAFQDSKTQKIEEGIPDLQDGLRELEEIVSVRKNIKESNIAISVDYPDPEMAAAMANYLLDALNEHMTGESRRVAKTNKAYLEGQIEKNPDPIIRQKIYGLIAQQIETIMMAEVKENFAFKVLDPPMVPDTKIKPKRVLMVSIALIVSLFMGIVIAFFKEYIEKLKAKPAGG
jgi:uncharacterized protein involved in exopolysaccharide biosynthesis